MKTTLIGIAAAALFATATGCHGAIVGNIVVLGITVGIFMGTLSLGRSTEGTRSASASTSAHTQH